MAFVKISSIINNTVSSPAQPVFTGGNTNGNTILVMTVSRGASDVITGVTDSEGNTYTKIATASDSDGTGTAVKDFWATPVTGGSGSNNTISAAFTGAAGVFAVAAEYSLLNNASLFDASNHGGGAVNTVSYTVTAAASGETLVTLLEQQGGAATFSALSGTARTPLSVVNIVVMDAVSVSGSNNISSFVDIEGQGSLTVALKSAPTGQVDTIRNSICTPAMIYGRAPNGVMSAVTTDGNGNIDLSGQTPAFVDTVKNNICVPVTIYGRAPNGQLQAVTTDGDGQLS